MSEIGRLMRRSSYTKEGISLAICNQNVLCISAIYQFLREVLPLYTHGVVVVIDEGARFCGKHDFLFEQIFLVGNGSAIVVTHSCVRIGAGTPKEQFDEQRQKLPAAVCWAINVLITLERIALLIKQASRF